MDWILPILLCSLIFGMRKIETAQRPIAETKNLLATDIDDVKLAMRECDDIENLKVIFGRAYVKANADQRESLKLSYEGIRDNLLQEKKLNHIKDEMLNPNN